MGPEAIPSKVEAMPCRLAVDALVFDMDGLLLDTESLAKQALRDAGLELGVHLPERLLRSMIGIPQEASRALMLEAHGTQAADRLLASAARRLEAFIDDGQLRIKPGVLQLLDLADRMRLPSAVATSSSRAKALHHLRASSLVDRFDAIVTRDDVGRGKPYPDLFLRAADLLKTAPSRCLAFEDSYNGVRAAHAAGMPVIMVPDLLGPTDEMRMLCRGVVADLHAVLPWLSPPRHAHCR